MSSFCYCLATIWGIVGTLNGYIWALAPLLFMVLVIAPVAIWEKDHKELERLKKPILAVSVKPKLCTEDTPFRHLEVKNPTGHTIKSCYGKIEKARRIEPTEDLPVNGVTLSWSTRHGHTGVLADIAPSSSKFLDFTQICDYRYFCIPCEGLNSGNWHRFTKDVYEVDVEFGSEDANFKPTRKTFQIDYKGDDSIEISDITPQ